VSDRGLTSVLSELEIRQTKDAIVEIDRTLKRIADRMPGLAKSIGEVGAELDAAAEDLGEVGDLTNQYVEVSVSGMGKLRLAYREMQEFATSATAFVEKQVSRLPRIIQDSIRRSDFGVAASNYGIAGLLLHGLKGMANDDVDANQVAQRFQRLSEVGRKEIENVKQILKSASITGLDARASLDAFAAAGIDVAEATSFMDKSAAGAGMRVAELTARLDEVFELQTGTSAKLASAISQNLGGSVGEAASMLASLGSSARAAGVDFQVMASSIEASVGSMRLGVQSAETLGKAYLNAASAAMSLFGNTARGRGIGAAFADQINKLTRGAEVIDAERGMAMRDFLLGQPMPEAVKDKIRSINDPLTLIELARNPVAVVPELATSGIQMDTTKMLIQAAMQKADQLGTGVDQFGGRTALFRKLIPGISDELAGMLAGEAGRAYLRGDTTVGPGKDVTEMLAKAEQERQNKEDPFGKLQQILENTVSILLRSIIQTLVGISMLIVSIGNYMTVEDARIASPSEVFGIVTNQLRLNAGEFLQNAKQLGTGFQQIGEFMGTDLYFGDAASRNAGQKDLAQRADTALGTAPAQSGAPGPGGPVTGTRQSSVVVTGPDGQALTGTVQESVVMIPVPTGLLNAAMWGARASK